MTTDWIKIGKVGKGHGLRGEFFISGRDEPLDSDISAVLIGEHFNSAVVYSVYKVANQGGRPLIKLDDFRSRTDSDKVLHFQIWVKREELDISEKEFYWDDLKGKSVALPDGKVIGTVVGLNNFGASDVIDITNEDKQSLSLPFIDQYFDLEASVDSDTVTLTVENDVIHDLWTGGKSKKKKPARKKSSVKKSQVSQKPEEATTDATQESEGE